jgi:hypothetical protein
MFWVLAAYRKSALDPVPGQSYTVESAVTLGATNAWTVLAEDILATNYFLTLQTDVESGTASFRIKNSDWKFSISVFSFCPCLSETTRLHMTLKS